MAYDVANPPQKLAGGIGGGLSLWLYNSADARATVEGAGYVSNGDDLGMKVGDLVLVVVSGTGAGSVHSVSAVTAGGAATIAAAVFV